jgi:hypothetical protein
MKKNHLKFFLGIMVAVLFICLVGSGPARTAAIQEVEDSRNISKQTDVNPAFWWNPKTVLIGMGDSLTQGTRDATNNKINTKTAYLQLVYEKLKLKRRLKFSQPFLNENENRINPFTIPTNLAVDGDDIFSVEGIEYARRDGKASDNYPTDEYFCDRLQPYLFADMHDKVLYPINLWAGNKVSQFDSLIWHLNNRWGKPAWVIFWLGNNDAALASLGLGGKNPEYIPIPFDKISDKLKPGVRWLLEYGKAQDVLSFAPYTEDIIENNLTEVGHFSDQFDHLMNRLTSEANLNDVEFFLLTLPYYTEVGYLMDKEDLEFYLQEKLGYTIPQTFEGRVSLLTFICMYALLNSGDAEMVDQILDETNPGYDEDYFDALVLSDYEREKIQQRIGDPLDPKEDSFNYVVRDAAKPDNFHLIDIGSYLNNIFKYGTTVGSNGVEITRRWGRGNGFSMDGVHGSNTAHALMANYILNELGAPTYDPETILMDDPYYDRDEDGWIQGPDYKASGRTKILFLFKDYQEDNSGSGAVIDTMSADAVWELISEALLEEIVDIPLIRMQAERMGLIPIK